MIKTNDVAAAQNDDGITGVAELIAAYERGSDSLRAAVADLTDAQVLSRPIAGKWSILEVVCHIADCEQFFADRMKRTLALDRPLLIGVDGSHYPEFLQYQAHDLMEEVELVTMTRRQMIRILRLISPDAWERVAVHTETGLVTLRQLLLHAIKHLQHHVRFIDEKRAALTK